MGREDIFDVADSGLNNTAQVRSEGSWQVDLKLVSIVWYIP